ncbi:MAG: GIY-YIG nuclease family protein [Christensenella sp.]
MDKTNYIYMLLCADNTLYTGWTNDIKKRLAAHQAGRGAKYTKGRLPVKLVYTETHATKPDALRRERAIKALKRNAKLALINNNK